MADVDNTARTDLVRRVEQKLRMDQEQREPLVLTWLIGFGVIAIFVMTLVVEWNTIRFALDQLFPTLSDGSGGLHGQSILALATLFGILLCDLLLDKISADWSERAQKRLRLAGLVSVIVFILSAMVLIPVSTWQANALEVGDGDSGLSTLAYIAFSLVLAALVPLSVLTNFLMMQLLKSAAGRIERMREVDARIRQKRDLLTQRETTLAAMRDVEKQQADIPNDDEVAEAFAARAAAVIGQEAGRIQQIIRLRQAAKNGTADAPFKATDDDYWNLASMEELETSLNYLTTFTPATIWRLASKEA